MSFLKQYADADDDEKEALFLTNKTTLPIYNEIQD